MDSKVVNKMNAKQRRQAKLDAQEDAYYKGLEAPKTSFVDTGNGITEVQTNSDQDEPITEKQVKPTTSQNYKPVSTKPVSTPAQATPAPAAQAPVESEPVKQVEADTDISSVVEPVTEETMDEAGINPNNTPEQNEASTKEAASQIGKVVDKDGRMKPLDKMEFATDIQKIGVFATIASIGLAILTKGAVPPVDFSAFTGLNEAYSSYLKFVDDYNTHISEAAGKTTAEEIRAGQEQSVAEKAAEIENVKAKDLGKFETEQAKEMKNLDFEHSKAMKQIDQLNQKEIMQLGHDLSVAMQDVLTTGQIQVIQANADVQKAVLEIMYNQDINKAADSAKALLNAGFSMNDLNRIAQFAKSQQGQTYYENVLRGINAGLSTVQTATEAVNAFRPTGSDEGTKDFFKRMLKF